MSETGAWLLSIALVIAVYLVAFIKGCVFGWILKQDKQDAKDVRDAEQMRAAIRDYDARVSEFVDPPSLTAQSESSYLGETAGAVTTKSLPLPPLPGA